MLDYPAIGLNVRISAKTGYGIDELLNAVAKALPVSRRRVTLLVPFSHGGILNEIRQRGEVISQEYTDSGIKIDAFADASYLDKISEYIL